LQAAFENTPGKHPWKSPWKTTSASSLGKKPLQKALAVAARNLSGQVGRQCEGNHIPPN
jgi:hypothetical protein